MKLKPYSIPTGVGDLDISVDYDPRTSHLSITLQKDNFHIYIGGLENVEYLRDCLTMVLHETKVIDREIKSIRI